MRRSARAAAAAAALTLVMTVVLVLPAIAAAASQGSYAGTYTGVATGKNDKGKKGSSGITVWVQVNGDQTTFTFRVDKLPVVFSATGTSQAGPSGGTLVPLSVNEAGISGSGTISIKISRNRWLMYGVGAGKAVKYKGTGKLVCWRVSTKVALPSTKQQFKDLFGALLGQKASTSVEVTETAAGGATDSGGASASPAASPSASPEPLSSAAPAAAETAGPSATVEPASVVDVASQDPPVPDLKKFSVLGLMILLLTMMLVLGLATPKEVIHPEAPEMDAQERDRREWEARHPADQAPTDVPPAGQPAADVPPAEQPPSEQPVAEQPPADLPPEGS
ncbi:MAG: hypothetical protein WCN81_07870 [Actinomycetes bacterium]